MNEKIANFESGSRTVSSDLRELLEWRVALPSSILDLYQTLSLHGSSTSGSIFTAMGESLSELVM